MYLPKEYADSKMWDQAWWMVSHWLGLVEQLEAYLPGECAILRPSGVVQKIVPALSLPDLPRSTRATPRRIPLNGPYKRSSFSR